MATNGFTPWQTAFAQLYSTVYANPDTVWVDANTRLALSKWLMNGSNGSAQYRLTTTQADIDGIKLGAAVSGLVNETTGNMLDLVLHPYMPYGCSIIQSTTLDIPDSGVGATSEVISAQEYSVFDWAPIQLTYDASTYWFGTLVHYAPAWSGALMGITS